MTVSGPITNSFISQRLKLNYVTWGDSSSQPLLLIHGGRDHCRSWDWVAERLKHKYYIIAPDLRGHGDSAWSPEGNYEMTGYVYDLAQLIHQLDLAPVTIVAHSMGGNIALRYTGIYPDAVRRLVAIEGIGPSPKMLAEREAKGITTRMRNWIDDKRNASGRQPKRYPSLEAALERMKAENSYLTDDQARHLTEHGINRNEDGSWSWKFDNYLNIWPSFDMSQADLQAIWGAITCPTLLMYGSNSWASNPADDGRLAYFKTANVMVFEQAGHWLHHDQFDTFMAALDDFL